MNTIFLATVIGWYLVIFSLIILFKQAYVRSVLTDIMLSRGLFFIMAALAFIVGLLIVVSHNVWVMGWPVIITIFGWLILLGSLFRLFFPETVHSMWGSMTHGAVLLNIFGIVSLIVGLDLILHAYSLHLWW